MFFHPFMGREAAACLIPIEAKQSAVDKAKEFTENGGKIYLGANPRKQEIKHELHAAYRANRTQQ